MALDDFLDVLCTTIAHFDFVSVEQLVKGVVWWEMFVNECKEFFCNVC